MGIEKKVTNENNKKVLLLHTLRSCDRWLSPFSFSYEIMIDIDRIDN
jgi:hypothetical protein